MRRACETALAISSAVPGCKVEVHPLLYEVGGIYRSSPKPQLSRGISFSASAGCGMTRQDFASSFPMFDVSRLPQDGPWNEDKGYESTNESIQRAADIANWLHSKELHQEVGEDGMVVLVSHADFLALLLVRR